MLRLDATIACAACRKNRGRMARRAGNHDGSESPCYTAHAKNLITAAMPQTPSLKDFRRIVVKVGSSLLVDSSAGALKHDWLASLAADIAGLHKDKRDVLVVSSGA